MDNPNSVTAQAVLDRLLERAKKGELAHVVVTFETKEGDTAVQASSMSIVQANHLWRVFDDRVRAMYREVRLRSRQPRSPTAGVSSNSPQVDPVVKAAKESAARVAPQLPRNKRRLIAKAVAKAARKAARASPPGPKPLPAPAGTSH